MKARILAIALLVWSCGQPLVPFYPYAEPFQPTEFHAKQYARAETCLGISGHYERVRWFLADFLIFDNVPADGIWRGPDEIYLIRDRKFNASSVLHESLHHVRGQKGHPPVPCCHGENWAVCA